MKTVILAAGEGSRMRPLTKNRPKVMLPVANKPLLEHIIQVLVAAGLRDYILVTGYQAQKVEQYFEDGKRWGVDIKYCRQSEPKGTADAISQVEPLVEETFLVVNGDTLYQTRDIIDLLKMNPPAMGVIEVDDARGMGAVIRQGEKITGIVEKASLPPTNIANAGAYLFSREIFPAISDLELSDRGEYEITDAIQLMIDKGISFNWHELRSWLTYSNPWDLLSGEQLFAPSMSQNLGTVEKGAVIKGDVGIGENTVVRAGSYICGPVVIGSGCDIGPNCYLRPFTSIGDGCHIGASVEVKNSIIMAGTSVPHLTYIGDSVIGERCNFGAGTQIANLRFDNSNIKAADQDTGRRKLGAIIGDDVSTGVNVSINSGTVIGSDSWISPGVFVKGYIESGSHVLQDQH